jgi:hypothetical protein
MVKKRGGQVLRQIAAARRVSLLRFGLEAERKGYFSQAIESYNCLIEQYPDSEEGKRARIRLRELGAMSENLGQEMKNV